MPSYSGEPWILLENQYLGGKSLFHWCPNTHLHSRRRMFNMYKKLVDSWGKPYTIHEGWYCPECGIWEGPYTSF